MSGAVSVVSEIKTCPDKYDLSDSLVFVAIPPSVGRTAKPRRAPRSGNLTPPRIAPSCPHCVNCGWAGVPLWADEVLAKQPARAAFGWTEIRFAPYWPSFCGFRCHPAGGPGAPSASLARSLTLFSCRICSCRGTERQVQKLLSLYLPPRTRFENQSFCQSINFFILRRTLCQRLLTAIWLIPRLFAY